MVMSSRLGATRRSPAVLQYTVPGYVAQLPNHVVFSWISLCLEQFNVNYESFLLRCISPAILVFGASDS
jgi:hypothetical protein